MPFDPNSEVIKLCAEGMNAEALGQTEGAIQLFQRAWDIAANDFEKFTAAHYMARNQKDPIDGLKWNLKALAFANAVNDESMKDYFSSLHLNIAKSYETTGDTDSARQYYMSAATFSEFLSAGGYGDLIKSGINAGLQRTGGKGFNSLILIELINQWCGAKELRPLSLVLPAYLGNLGSENDLIKLLSALSFLSAAKCLPADQQGKIDTLILELSVHTK